MNTEPPNRPQRSSGPWMLKIIGIWGSGRRSLNDFEIHIVDFGRPPDEDPEADPERESVTSWLREDVAPQAGLDVQFGEQILRPGSGLGSPQVLAAADTRTADE